MDWDSVNYGSIDSMTMELKFKKLETLCFVKTALVVIEKRLMYDEAKRMCLNLGGQMVMELDEQTSFPQSEKFKIGIATTCADGIWIPAIQGPSISSGKYRWLDDRPGANKSMLNISMWAI